MNVSTVTRDGVRETFAADPTTVGVPEGAVRSVLCSWRAVLEVCPEKLTRLHFGSFLKRCDEATRRMFLYTDMVRHHRIFARVLTRLIEEAATPLSREDFAELRKLAHKHAHFGVTPSQLELFCECLVDSVCSLHDSGEPGELRQAWVAVLRHMGCRFETVSELCRDALSRLDDSRRGSADDSADSSSEIESSGDTLVQLRDSAFGAQQQCDHRGYLQISMYGCLRPRRDPKRDGHSVDFFRQRWCELQGQFLYYFFELGAQPAGLIDLGNCELLETDRRNRDGCCSLPSPGPFSLILRQREGLPYYFIAQGEYDQEQWFAKLRQACNRFSYVRGDITVGQRLRAWIRELGRHETGVCRWIGESDALLRSGCKFVGDPGTLYVGVELDRPLPEVITGSCGIFDCSPEHAVIVSAHQVSSSTSLDVQIFGQPLPSRYSGPADFEWLAVIGQGAFGRVCKVRSRQAGEIYACKVLQRAALVKEESSMRHVRRESSLLLNIRHPYIVKLHAVFQSPGRLFLLFTFLSGGELFWHLRGTAQVGFPEARARFYIAEVALAVGHLHSLHIVHRDLKAQNLVLDSEGHVVLTDFGFAKTIDAGVRNTDKLGTPPYMAPEILQQPAEGYSYEVDWWALGVLLFLMLTGCYPFYHTDANMMVRQIQSKCISVSRFPTGRPLSLNAREACCQLLRKDPARRLADIETFMQHKWFSDFPWSKCMRRELAPPFIPDKRGKTTQYFNEWETLQNSCGGSSMPPPSPDRRRYTDTFVSFCDVHRDYKEHSTPFIAPAVAPSGTPSCSSGGGVTEDRLPLYSSSSAPRTQGTEPTGGRRASDDVPSSPRCRREVEDEEFLCNLNASQQDPRLTPYDGPSPPPKAPTSPLASLPPTRPTARFGRPVTSVAGFNLWPSDELPCPV